MQFAAYLVDGNGFNPNPVLSEMPDEFIDAGEWGYLKISYDKSICIFELSHSL